MKKTGLILEGGAMRGFFTSGALDFLREKEIDFPYIAAVSAGAINAMCFVSGISGREVIPAFYHNAGDCLYGLQTFMKTGTPVDLDKMFFEYPYKHYPFDFKALFDESRRMEFVLTGCETGEAAYLSEKQDETRLLTIGKASCSLPVISKPVLLDGKYYIDGSIADSIPIERGFQQGCDRLVVICTKAENQSHTDYRKFRPLFNLNYSKTYPKLFEACMNRSKRYEEQAALLKAYENQGRAYVIRPVIPPIGSFEASECRCKEYYDHGCALMKEKISELEEFLNEDTADKRKPQSREKQYS